MKGYAVGGGLIAAMATTGLLAVAAITPVIASSDDSDSPTVAAVSCMLPGDNTTADGLSADQMSNAAAIIATGTELGFSEQGIVVALATAAQESMFRSGLTEDLSDRDSAGLFQQRAAWGSLADRMDPAKSTTMFFKGGQAGQRGLEDIAGWESMPVWQAAQSVQVSAFPQAYAKWEPLARTLAGGVKCDQDSGDFKALPGATAGEKAVNAAARWIGTPYSWGGGNYQGPTRGIAQGAGTVGFDCSGLTMYAWYQAAGIHLDHFTDNQAAATVAVTQATAQAGDLLFFSASAGGVDSGTYPHMGIYDGQGGMIHAPRTGKDVERVAGIFTDPYWSGRLARIGRPTIPTA